LGKAAALAVVRFAMQGFGAEEGRRPERHHLNPWALAFQMRSLAASVRRQRLRR